VIQFFHGGGNRDFWNVTPFGLVEIFTSLHGILSPAVFLLAPVEGS
jgi:hypothetical protein